jgi:hypothetical protein
MSDAALALPDTHRRWLLINALGIATVLNLVINLLLAWNQTRDGEHVKLWSISVAHPSVGTDALGTLLILPLTTTFLASWAVHREIRRGAIAPLPSTAVRRWSWLAVTSTPRRAGRFAIATFVVLAVPAVDFLEIGARHGMSAHNFLTFHVIFAVALGMIVTPLVMLVAMTDRAADDAA